MDEYLGFKEVSLNDEEISSLFQPDLHNTFGCVTNQYLVANDAQGNNIGLFRSNGERLLKVPYKTVKGRFLGTVKPRNIQQQMALDLLYNSDITVKIITGKFGTGKILCSAA